MPRAELFAVIRLLQRIRPEAGATTSIAVDCEYVVNGAREGPEHTMKLDNSDLWKVFWNEYNRHDGAVYIYKIPAHQTYSHMLRGRCP